MGSQVVEGSVGTTWVKWEAIIGFGKSTEMTWTDLGLKGSLWLLLENGLIGSKTEKQGNPFGRPAVI